MELSKDNDYQELLGRISQTYTEGRLRAYQAVDKHMTETYWKIGHDIVEYEQGGKAKAAYGKALLANLSRDLTLRHGRGFSRSNLVRFRQFYLAFPIGATASHQVLFILIQRRDRIVTKDDYIKTVPRRGYRFAATVNETWDGDSAREIPTGELRILVDQKKEKLRDLFQLGAEAPVADNASPELVVQEEIGAEPPAKTEPVAAADPSASPIEQTKPRRKAMASGVSFSPDGSQFVFRRHLSDRRQVAMFVANADGGDVKEVAAIDYPESLEYPAWSPDGRWIVCAAGHSWGGKHTYVIAMGVGEWKLRQVSAQKWRWIGQTGAAWCMRRTPTMKRPRSGFNRSMAGRRDSWPDSRMIRSSASNGRATEPNWLACAGCWRPMRS